MDRVKTWYLFDWIPLMTITERIEHDLTVPIEWVGDTNNEDEDYG